MATLRRKGLKWHVQIRRAGSPSLTRSFTHKADALSWARQTEAEADRAGLLINTSQLRSMTVGDLIRRYRDAVTPRKRCREMETLVLGALLRHPMAALSLANAKPSIFADYVKVRLASRKPETVRRELNILGHMFTVARRDWGIPLSENPVHAIQKPAPGRPRDRRLDPVEYDRLIAALPDSRVDYLRPIVLLAIETGMRRGELLAMCWQDIDWEKGTLHIPLTKNGHPRTIPLTPQAQAILRHLQHDEPCVFSVTPNALKLAWNRLKERAGAEGLHFHDLRHEAISRFFEMGLSVPEVALISGHRDFRMLFRYTHLRAEDVAKKLIPSLRQLCAP